MEQSPMGVMITDPQGCIKYVNSKLLSITQFSAEDLLEKNPSIFKSGLTTLQQHQSIWNALQKGQDWNGEIQNKRKNGEIYWENQWISPLLDEQGQISHYVAIKEDITERKNMEKALHEAKLELEQKSADLQEALRVQSDMNHDLVATAASLKKSLHLQEQISQRLDDSQQELNQTNREMQRQYRQLKRTQGKLIQSEKMAGLATLVAGTAHELNNPVNFVTIGANYLETELKGFQEQLFELIGAENDPEIIIFFQKQFKQFYMAIDNILTGSKRIEKIVKDLRTFSRLDESERMTIDLVESLESVVHLIQTQFQTTVDFQTEFQSFAKIECWPAKMNQVFMNIIYNGCQAIQQMCKDNPEIKQGKLLISTFTREQKGKHFLVVQVKDDGCGMSEEVKQKIFEPFFTTRTVGIGSGLGMTIAYGIIKEHNGLIEVESTVGTGTTVSVFLPL